MTRPHSVAQSTPTHSARAATNTPHANASARPNIRHRPPAPPASSVADPKSTISRHRLLHDAALMSFTVASTALVTPNANAIGTSRPPPAPLPELVRTSRSSSRSSSRRTSRPYPGFKKDLSKARRNSGVRKSEYLDLDISRYNVTETVTEATSDTTTPTSDTTTSTIQRPINTLKYYDTIEGTKSPPIAAGDSVTVHFDCIFRKIDAVSTRSARLLGENRVLAEPFTFIAGSQLDAPRAITTDAGGGLFSGQTGPKPPQALSYAVVGMKVGGKRSVFVPAVLGYGAKGEQEIPPNCPEFELQIELLRTGSDAP